MIKVEEKPQCIIVHTVYISLFEKTFNKTMHLTPLNMVLQCIELSNKDNAELYFKDYHKQLNVPFVFFVDFESLATKIHTES